MRPYAIFGPILLLYAPVSPCVAQFLPTLQANTPEEFTAYLNVLESPTPRERLAASETFLAAWPHSELLVHVCELAMESARTLGDAEKAIRAGEGALAVAPDYIPVLAGLALILPNETSDPARLTRTETYARRALDLLTTFRPPRRVSLEEWERARGGIESQAHAALGMVAFKRGDPARAIREFETAVSVAVVPDAVQYYRLGLLYRRVGKEQEAREKLRRAAELGDESVRRLAADALKNGGRQD